MSTLKIRLVGADTYSFRKKKYVRGKLYELPEDEAEVLLEKGDERGYAYFELPHERDVDGEETTQPEATTASERKAVKAPAKRAVKRASKKAAKKTLKVGGGSVTETGSADDGDGGEGGDDGDGEGVEV